MCVYSYGLLLHLAALACIYICVSFKFLYIIQQCSLTKPRKAVLLCVRVCVVCVVCARILHVSPSLHHMARLLRRRYEANMRFHAERRPGLGEADEREEEGDVKLTELDINHIPIELREYRVASTGARVTLASAKPLLYMFCAKLPADRQAPPHALGTNQDSTVLGNSKATLAFVVSWK